MRQWIRHPLLTWVDNPRPRLLDTLVAVHVQQAATPPLHTIPPTPSPPPHLSQPTHPAQVRDVRALCRRGRQPRAVRAGGPRTCCAVPRGDQRCSHGGPRQDRERVVQGCRCGGVCGAILSPLLRSCAGDSLGGSGLTTAPYHPSTTPVPPLHHPCTVPPHHHHTTPAPLHPTTTPYPPAVGAARALPAPPTPSDSLDAAQTFSCYLATTEGTLLALKPSATATSKWVRLKAPRAMCVVASATVVACGCAGGVVRLFRANTLQYLVRWG